MPVLPFDYQKTQSVIRPRVAIESGMGSPTFVDDQGQLQNSDLQDDRGGPAIDPSLIGAWQPPTVQPADQPSTPAQPLPPASTPRPVAPVDVPPPAADAVDTASMGAAPVLITHDKYGRPTDQVIGPGSDLDKAKEQLSAVDQYQPKNAHGWHRYVPALLAGWAAGQRTNPNNPFAGIGGAVTGALTGQFNPTFADDAWKSARQAALTGQVKNLTEQKRMESQIANANSLSAARVQNAQTRAEHEKYVQGNAAIQNIQKEYASRKTYDPNDPTELTDPNSLTQRAAKLGITLGARNAAQRGGFTFEGKRWEYGPDGKPKPLTNDDGSVITDPMYDQRIQDIKDQIRHRGVEEAAAQTRNKIAQQRLNIAQQNGAGQAKFTTQLNQARQAVNRFNDLTRRAAEAASWGDSMAKQREKALLDERDKLEDQIKGQYGDYIKLDDKDKPSGLRDRWSRSDFLAKHPNGGGLLKQAEQQAMDEGRIVVP